ncbi:MAG: membrane dipeptidase [Acidobacteria bacterium]|nr:membrane dipeptidase [Acidobacteriota bacterium]
MQRRQWLKAVASAGLGVVCVPMINRGRFRLFAGSPVEYSAKAIELVQRSVVIDMLSPFKISTSPWLTNPDTFKQADFQRFKDSSINVFHIAVGMGGPEAHMQTLRYVASWNSFIANHDQWLMRVDSADDLNRVKASGKVGVLIGVQNSEHFRTPADVDLFYSLGQRVSQLTYNTRNMIGNGSTERRDDGISDFGVAIIERMNKLGMAVDVSHCGDRTTLDAFDISKQPVLITHSNCRALAPGHPRCKSDEAIKKMGAAGSVMGITGVRMFVKNDEPTTIEHCLDHFDHVKKLVGVEHLGVGSDIDLDGYDDMPEAENKRLRAGYKGSYGFRDKIDIEGIDHPKRMFDLTEGLIRRKYTDREIELVLGGNFKRVLSQIWTV